MDQNQLNINRVLNDVRAALDLFSENIDIMEKYFCGFEIAQKTITIPSMQVTFKEPENPKIPEGFMAWADFVEKYQICSAVYIYDIIRRNKNFDTTKLIKIKQNNVGERVYYIDPIYMINKINKSPKNIMKMRIKLLRKHLPELEDLCVRAGI
jgi:hypothetical protein